MNDCNRKHATDAFHRHEAENNPQYLIQPHINIQGKCTVLTGSFIPEGVEISHEYGIINLPEESFQYIRHVLYEVISNTEFHIAGVLTKLLHQKLDSWLCTVFPVYTLMAQTCVREIQSFSVNDTDLDRLDCLQYKAQGNEKSCSHHTEL